MTLEPELAIERDVPQLDTAAKRALIEKELRNAASRSDREIARIVGCDHKTVAARRREMGIADPLGNSPPTPTDRRNMLIAGAEDFNKLYPPGPSEPATAAEQVDEAIAKGAVSLAPEHQKMVDAAFDQCRGIRLRNREERQEQADSEGEKNKERCILLPRKEVTIQHDDDMGEWIIRQRNWPDEDGVVTINDEDIHRFVDILTDHLGYGRAP
jgi:hypothetical protein